MFEVRFETRADTFTSDGAFEVCAVLRRLYERVRLEAEGGSSEGEGPVRDSNGNTIGHWTMSLDD